MRNRKKPGTLGRVFKALAEAVEKEARKQSPPNRARTFSRPSSVRNKQGASSNQGVNKKICQYWNCNVAIRNNYFLCADHYNDLEDYVIDKCPECGRFKDVEYDVCKDCYGTLTKKGVVKKPASPIRKEHSKTWEKGDQGVEKFFVYILKDAAGKFYIGHTRDLRLRLGEHRDGKTKSTAGRNLKLQYYEETSNRNSSELKEVELKKLLDSNERKIRKMIQDFQDLHREVETN